MRVGEQVCKVIVTDNLELSQMVGTSSKIPAPIIRMRLLANPKTRGMPRPRTADILIESMKRCCAANPRCAYCQECLDLWDTLSSANVIPLYKGETLVDPTKGRVMPGAWMAASCSRVIQDERRN